MEFLRVRSWADALAVRSGRGGVVPVAGGTDVMVALNAARLRPDVLLDLTAVPELAEWGPVDGGIRIGAGVPYTRLVEELSRAAPALAAASRTVGSPQIRNRGTLGGNLGTASPAGDTLPPLLAAGAQVELASTRGVRRVPLDGFCTGPHRTVMAGDELVAAVYTPVADGPQVFAKVGTRNAMVIAVCSFALALHPGRREVGTGLGSVAPTPLRAGAAERFLAAELSERGLWESRGPLPDGVVERFGDLVAGGIAPIDDVRSSAAYRAHAVGVVARRVLRWAWEQYRAGEG